MRRNLLLIKDSILFTRLLTFVFSKHLASDCNLLSEKNVRLCRAPEIVSPRKIERWEVRRTENAIFLFNLLESDPRRRQNLKTHWHKGRLVRPFGVVRCRLTEETVHVDVWYSGSLWIGRWFGANSFWHKLILAIRLLFV